MAGDWAPEQVCWYQDLDLSDGYAEPELQLSRRQVRQMAYHIGESVTLQEAIRMGVAQGIQIMRRDPAAGIGNPDIPPIDEQPNSLWFDDLVLEEQLSKKVRIPEPGVRQLAMTPQAALALSLPEAVDAALNAALATRVSVEKS